jgi:putative membrane protein
MMIPPVTPPRWQEALKCAVMLGMGLYLAALIFSNRLSNYINLQFGWLTLMSAVLLIGMGLWGMWQMRRPTTSGTAHLPIQLSSLFVLAIPLLLGVLVPSQPLSASAITGGVSLNPVGGSTVQSYVKPPLERNILEWLREFSNTDNPSAFDGMEVDVVGFIYREPEMQANQFMVARFTMSCCVADAFAIGLPITVTDESTADLADGTWIRVRGTLKAGTFSGDAVPIITPTAVEPIDMPEQPYLYS